MKRSFWMAIGITLILTGAALLCIDEIEVNPKFGQPQKYFQGGPERGKIVKVDEHWPWSALGIGAFLFLFARSIPNGEAAPSPPAAKH